MNLVILVDDGSTDATLDIARELGLAIFVHDRNYGYGANQKTCYTEALKAGREIVVMKGGGSAIPEGYRGGRIFPTAFSQQIIAQAVAARFRIAEIAVLVRYFPEASSAGFWAACAYGLKILWVVTRSVAHRSGLRRSRRLQNIRQRCTDLGRQGGQPPGR